MSLITKSGTNKFHGGAYEYNRPTMTVSNNYFNKQSELASGQANVAPKLIRNIFGADVGGPILKDKLFFFGNYEGTRQAENAEVIRTVATPAYLAGNLTYLGDDTAGNVVPVTLSPGQVATLDNGCISAGDVPTRNTRQVRVPIRMRWLILPPSRPPTVSLPATGITRAHLRSPRPTR